MVEKAMNYKGFGGKSSDTKKIFSKKSKKLAKKGSV